MFDLSPTRLARHIPRAVKFIKNRELHLWRHEMITISNTGFGLPDEEIMTDNRILPMLAEIMRSRKIRELDANRCPLLPEIPTLAESAIRKPNSVLPC
ncbi:hypothetical protein CR155_11170 [Pollutimonas nitritireducens]|uniref:Uncharacterized protein n=1 Tax=Pollutimonas nitritireducens TaxID=2045209 RepID=A0A2N4UG46_9BURK|nr:hypothetical protein CR155_11170 [Pollutimonas nitritireducens]